MKLLKKVLLTLSVIAFLISCKKEYSYESGNTGLTSGTWQFQDSVKQYIGNIDSATIQNFGSTKVLTLIGISLDGQQNFRIRLYDTAGFTTKTYLSSLSQNDFDYFTSSKTIFVGDVLGGEFTVNITSLSNGNITGTFSGFVKDSTSAQTQITLGQFTSKIDLSSNGVTSAGTLGATADSCTGVILSGTYTSGVTFSSANTAQVQVNVTTPGSFVIATNSVNGVYFTKSGTFTTTGVQSIALDGIGTPQGSGVQYFTVTYGTGNCIFPVTFLPGTGPVGDYFPTTITSNWAYGLEGGSTADSILAQVIPDAPTFGGNVYSSLMTESIPPSGSKDTVYYRKVANDYYTYYNVSKVFQFDNPVYGEYIFLNDAAPVNTTITSPNFSGTVSGIPVTIYIKATITEKAVPATIGALNFSDVIKVGYQYFSTAAPGVPLATEERWYARGVGLIYENLDDTTVYNIGRYMII